MMQLRKVLNMSTDLFGGVNEGLVWMGTPNPIFFDYSPAEYVLGGRGRSVILWLKEVTETPSA
jgi:uncharacterized protein (DUF2384 family)